MTTDDEPVAEATTNDPTPRANGNPGGRGIPRGRQRCGGCGAEGVNIRTCPGDGSPHEATTVYQERVNGPRQETREAVVTHLPPTPEMRANIRAIIIEDQAERDDLLDDLEATDESVELSESESRGSAAWQAAPEAAELEAETWGSLQAFRQGLRRPAGPPAREDLQVTHVTVRLATTYPALNAARLEAFIEEELDECLWLATDLVRLVPGED